MARPATYTRSLRGRLRFRIERDALAEAVAWTARALPARPVAPVLAGMLLDVGDRLTVSGFDYEVSAQTALDVNVEAAGRALVPGRLLAEISRSLPASHPVDIVSTGNEVVVTCGNAEFGLLQMPVEDYPNLPAMPPIAGRIGSDAFAAAVGQVVLAASRDDTLPMLTGVRVDIDGQTVKLACTDRYRIAVRELTWQPQRPDIRAAAVVPARTLADVSKSLRSGAEISISLAATDDEGGDGLIGFTGSGRRMTTRLLDEQFIEYRSRFSVNWTTRAELRTAPFVEAVKRVALVVERNTPIRLSFSPGTITIQASTDDAARATEQLDAQLDGDDILVAFNPQYLLDGLAGVESDTVRLCFTTPTKPAVITGKPAAEAAEPDYRHLLMPIRLSA